jgi:hypothetical protein
LTSKTPSSPATRSPATTAPAASTSSPPSSTWTSLPTTKPPSAPPDSTAASSPFPLSPRSLPPAEEPFHASPRVVAKLSGDTLAVSLLEDARLRLFRCVQLGEDSFEEATAVLATTLAYAEDELGQRAAALQVCGLARGQFEWIPRWRGEFGLPVCGVRGRLGEPSPFNAGLLGYLESLESA